MPDRVFKARRLESKEGRWGGLGWVRWDHALTKKKQAGQGSHRRTDQCSPEVQAPSQGGTDSGCWGSRKFVVTNVQLFATPWTVAPRRLCPWDFPGKTTRVGCYFLLRGIFLTQGWNASLPIGRRILYHWATWEAPSGVMCPLLWVLEE